MRKTEIHSENHLDIEVMLYKWFMQKCTAGIPVDGLLYKVEIAEHSWYQTQEIKFLGLFSVFCLIYFCCLRSFCHSLTWNNILQIILHGGCFFKLSCVISNMVSWHIIHNVKLFFLCLKLFLQLGYAFFQFFTCFWDACVVARWV